MVAAIANKLYALTPTDARHFASEAGCDLIHSYKSKRQDNGAWSIQNLDIFQACERKNRAGGVDVFDADWLRSAAKKFQERKAGGYLPPAHIDHHGDDGASRKYAGLINDLRYEEVNGVPTLKADIGNIPPEVFRDIAQLRLPFRSVEIGRPDTPEISSLALMSTVVPYFKLPVTKVSFSADDRVCFSDYGGMGINPDTQGVAVVTQRFNAPYAPKKRRTSAVKFMGRCTGQNYAEDDEEEQADDQQFPAEGMQDDGSGMEQDDLLALMQALQAQGAVPADDNADPAMGGMDDVDPELMDLAAQEGVPVEEIMGKLDTLIESTQATNALLQQMARGQASNMGLPSPPPTVSADDTKETKVNFSDDKPKQNSEMPPWAQAMQSDVSKAIKIATEAAESIRKFNEERAQARFANELAESLNEAANKCLDAIEDTKKFNDDQVEHGWNLAWKSIKADFNDAVEGKIKPEEIDVQRHFNDVFKGFTPNVPGATKTPKADGKTSATPRSTVPQEHQFEAESLKYAEKVAESCKDMPRVSQAFSDDKEAFTHAVMQFREVWDGLPDVNPTAPHASKTFHRNNADKFIGDQINTTLRKAERNGSR